MRAERFSARGSRLANRADPHAIFAAGSGAGLGGFVVAAAHSSLAMTRKRLCATVFLRFFSHSDFSTI